jgi:hypothetical protein
VSKSGLFEIKTTYGVVQVPEASHFEEHAKVEQNWKKDGCDD